MPVAPLACPGSQTLRTPHRRLEVPRHVVSIPPVPEKAYPGERIPVIPEVQLTLDETDIVKVSNLVIAVLSTSSGFLGKLLTGQIPFLMTFAVVIGASLGAVAGEWSHRRVSPRALRYVYAALVGAITVRTWITILG